MAEGTIKLYLDGRLVSVPAGSTVLDAASRAEVYLPTLCQHGKLEPAEACRLCLVEVEGFDRPQAACGLEASPGMRVTTASPGLLREREEVFRLLLAEHYGDCLAPCSQRCPANIDIQGYIALIARGRFTEATRLIRRTNPLPMTCGRVCPHPCESQCRRGRVDEPVNINHLKRFASDIAYQDIGRLNPKPKPATGKKVAVIGGGPAGLSAAYYLALMGHAPTIFEANPQLGGMLRYGIPEYRLPKAVLDREIEAILAVGVEARIGQVWGRDFSLESLREQGFAAIFLGTGAAVNRELDFLAEGTAGVNYGTCFLGQVALGQDTGVGKRVAVIGGGNTAMDCARTSLRLGAEEVTVFYRRSRNEMPAQDIEVEEAEEEGIVFNFLVTPVAMEEENGRLSALTMLRMQLSEPDASGRARPVPVEGSEYQVPVDTVIVAVGQTTDNGTIAKDPLGREVALTRWETVDAQADTGLTNLDGVFAAGDLVSGPATVVEAIGGGRRAAQAMDRYLKGKELAPPRRFIFSKGELKRVDEINFHDRPKAPRAQMPSLKPDERRSNFQQVELGLSREAAQAEALRCLSCGCQAAHYCLLRDVADQMGLRELLVEEKVPADWGIRDGTAHITIEEGKCIVCRRCERACADYHGREAIRVEVERIADLTKFRGRRVEINQRCDDCGLCVALCPTGALSYKTPWPKPGPLPLDWASSVCNLCSLTCQVTAGRLDGHLACVRGAEAPPAFGHLCRHGRLDLLADHSSPDRIIHPLIKGEGSLEPAGWEQALDQIASALGDIRERHGSSALAGLALGRGSLEEMYLFGKLVRLGLFTNNLDFMSPKTEEPETGRMLAHLAGSVGRLKYPQIEHQDLVVVVGSETSRRMPLLEAALHRCIKGGGRLILLGADAALAPRAHLHLDLGMKDGLDWASGLVAGAGEHAEARVLLRRAGRALVLVDVSSLDLDSFPSFEEFLGVIRETKLTQASMALIPTVPGAMAMRRAGISPDHYPGHRLFTTQSRGIMERVAERPLPAEPGLAAREILEGAREGKVKGLFVFAGHNPPWEQVSQSLREAARAVDFCLVLATHQGALIESADVVLPGLTVLESQGAFVGADGTKYEVEPALPAPEGVWPVWQTLIRLLVRLGGPPGPADLLGVQSEIIVLDEMFTGAAYGRQY